MKFLHITDIHYLNNYPQVEDGYLSIFKGMTNPIEQLKRGLEKINLEEIDAVLLSGDLVECGDEADYSALKQHLEAIFLEIPLVITLGNHDTRPAFYKGWLGEVCDAPYHTVTRIGDMTIIGFDVSDEKDQTGLMTEAHYAWLEKALERAKGTDTILMLHHHLLEHQATIPPIAYEKRFYDMIEKSHIVAVLTGHTHHPYAGEFAGKPYFTAQNLSFSGIDESKGKVRFEEYSGFNLCTLENHCLSVTSIEAITDKRLLTKVVFK